MEQEQTTQPKTSNKWKSFAIFFILTTLIFAGAAAFLYVSSLDDEDDQTSQKCPEVTSGYFTIEEWGVKFVAPNDAITDVKYVIVENAAFLIGRDARHKDVQYAGETTDEFIRENALAIIFRGTERDVSEFGRTASGMKIGDHYYHTAWSFSSIATGVGIPTAFGDNQEEAGSAAFFLLNDLLKTLTKA